MASTLDLLPITDLTFDGTVLMRDDGLFLWLRKGAGEVPGVRGVDVVVPARVGRVARNRVADRLLVELEGIVGGIRTDDGIVIVEEPVSYYALVLEMAALFDPTKDPATLSYTLPDSSVISLLARTTPPLLWDETIPGRLARLNVALEVVDL